MELIRRKGKEVVRAEDIYPNEEEAQQFIQRGFQRTQKINITCINQVYLKNEVEL